MFWHRSDGCSTVTMPMKLKWSGELLWLSLRVGFTEQKHFSCGLWHAAVGFQRHSEEATWAGVVCRDGYEQLSSVGCEPVSLSSTGRLQAVLRAMAECGLRIDKA